MLTTITFSSILTTFAPFAAPPDTLVPYPNPLITEIHFNVRGDGDATQDGQRDAVGDEFIELINPHDKPIRLRGFTLVDSEAYTNKSGSRNSRSTSRDPDDSRQNDKGAAGGAGAKNRNDGRKQDGPNDGKDEDGDSSGGARQVRFTFPDIELKPGEVAVVFNGYKQNIPGSVGSQERGFGSNENFHDGHVFSMRIASKYAAFDNTGDWVLLSDPAGKAVQLVRWGQPKEKLPQNVPLVEDAPESDGSVQRDGLTGKLTPHDSLKGYEKLMFSPGRFDFPGRSDRKPGERGGDNDATSSERERTPAKKRP